MAQLAHRAGSLMLPRLLPAAQGVGFAWADPDGTPTPLVDLLDLPGAEPDRWLPTHLEALDDLLIDVAGRLGEVMGGGRAPTSAEREDLERAYLAIDRGCAEYDAARRHAALPEDVRAGQILGTAALMSIRCRAVLGMVGPAPFEGELDQPSLGMVGGHAGLHVVDAAAAWRGSRWLVVTEAGLRLPATLSMLLFDASGVDKDATLREHREALRAVTAAAQGPGVEPMTASGAVDWLLFDWVMAHRDSPQSGAVQIASGRLDDATMIVEATAASVGLRRRFDPALDAALR